MAYKKIVLITVLSFVCTPIFTMKNANKSTYYSIANYLVKKKKIPAAISTAIRNYAEYNTHNAWWIKMEPVGMYRSYQMPQLLSIHNNTLALVNIPPNPNNDISPSDLQSLPHTFEPFIGPVDGNTMRIDNKLGPHRDEYTINSDSPHTAILFDGFNHTLVALLALNYIYKNQPHHKMYLFSRHNPLRIFNAKGKMLFQDEEYQPGTIDALGLYHKKNYYMLCTSYTNTVREAICYQTYSYKMQYNSYSRHEEYRCLLPEKVRKICMLSPSLSLFLSDTGSMYSLHRNKKGVVSCDKKNINDRYQKPLLIKNFAVNPLLPYLVIFLTNQNNLYLLNLKEKNENAPFLFTQLASTIQTDYLWFYNNNIGYLDSNHIHLNTLVYGKLHNFY